MSKLLFYIFLSAFIFISCNNNNGKKDNGLDEVRLDGKTSNADIVRMPVTADTPLDTNNIAKITMEETDFNFGSVNEGDVVKHTFKLKNVGNQPLLITDIRTTCGCTVPSWNKSPISANANDQVEVKFDTKGKANEQIKKITIIANTFPAETELILRGMVQTSK
jgi:PBP1b-binding outer membrane lipoprotein LpoB